MNLHLIRAVVGPALALALTAACAPQMAQTEYSPTEQDWQKYLRTNYPEWRAPQTIPPLAGMEVEEPGMDVVPEFVPGEIELGPVVPEAPPAPDAAAQTYVVEKGDSLWTIAVKFYGNGGQWQQIYEANRDRIPDPAKLRPGTELIIPGGANILTVVPK